MGYRYWWLLSVGFGLSLFYGLFAIRIFIAPRISDALPNYRASRRVHEFLLNFLGSAMGWALVIVFLKIVDRVGGPEHVRTGHWLLLLLGLVGVVGWLPHLVSSTIQGVAGAVSALIEKAASKL